MLASPPPGFAEKPIWKRWWFWVGAVAILAIIGSVTGDGSNSPSASRPSPLATSTTPTSPTTTPLQTVKVPDLVGLTLLKAANRAKKSDLVIKLAKKYSSEQPGTVLQTDPSPGTKLKPGSRLTLTLAKPFPRVAGVVGASLGKAQRALKKDEFVVRTRQVFDHARKGTVLSQSPSSGTQARPGRTVVLTISTGCEPGYSVCLNPLLSDYDCAGGTGDGPAYVSGPVRVTGFDPFGLDADGNGIGCE
jgi:hypothetical protein